MNATHGRMCVSTPSNWTNCSQTFHFTWNFHNDLATQIFLYRLCDWNIIFTAAALSIQNREYQKTSSNEIPFQSARWKSCTDPRCHLQTFYYESHVVYSYHMLCITILAFLSSIVVSVGKFYLKSLEKLPSTQCSLLLFSYLFPSSQAHRFSEC